MYQNQKSVILLSLIVDLHRYFRLSQWTFSKILVLDTESENTDTIVLQTALHLRLENASVTPESEKCDWMEMCLLLTANGVMGIAELRRQ